MGSLRAGLRTHPTGHHRPMTNFPNLSFKGPVATETCRIGKTCYSANPAIGPVRTEQRVSGGQRTFDATLLRGSAFPSDELQLPTPMCTPQLCAHTLRIALPAAVLAGDAAHSYSVFRKRMSESGAWYRRICVLGASSRASALSFIARSAST